MRTHLFILSLAAVLALQSDAMGATPIKLNAVVGPGFTITLKKGTVKVTILKKGAYTIVVSDKASNHNFHLTGPGVNKKTTVSEIVTRTWNLTLNPGTFKYVCDPHLGTMKGTFKVTS